jgi:hypothetical protein
MAILNYTTTIAAEKTAAEIQMCLAKAGAQAILCEYDSEGVMFAMSFRIGTPHGVISFRMPAQLDGVYKALCKDSKVAKRLKTRQQASNVAWRITKDWIEAQLAITQAGMAEMAEVFLPYAQDSSGRTVYDALKSKGFPSLTHQPQK